MSYVSWVPRLGSKRNIVSWGDVPSHCFPLARTLFYKCSGRDGGRARGVCVTGVLKEGWEEQPTTAGKWKSETERFVGKSLCDLITIRLSLFKYIQAVGVQLLDPHVVLHQECGSTIEGHWTLENT